MEQVLWAEEEWEATAWGVAFEMHLVLGWHTSIKFTSKYFWLFLAAQAVLVTMLSDVHARSDPFKTQKVIQASINKVFKNKLWLWGVQGEGVVNMPFPAGSTAESPQIQLFPPFQKEVKKTVLFRVSFLSLNQLSDYDVLWHPLLGGKAAFDCMCCRGYLGSP